MLGADASEIVPSLAVALTAGATKAMFDRTIAVHPTGGRVRVDARALAGGGRGAIAATGRLLRPARPRARNAVPAAVPATCNPAPSASRQTPVQAQGLLT
jgi:hypothetical protein